MSSNNTDSALSNSSRLFWRPFDAPSEVLLDPPRRVQSAEGIYVRDDRHRLIDAVGGLWNVNLGYSQTPIKEAIRQQLDILPYTSVFRGNTTDLAEELAQVLLDDWFGEDGMSRVFYTAGGSDSVETALRLARQYWKVMGQADRYKFISLKRAYHGTHFGGSSVGGNANSRRFYEPLLQGCYHIPAPFTYRNPFDEQDPERLAVLCARFLEEEIVFQGPDTVAAFIAEPVMGAGGVIVPPPGFWPLCRQICDKYGVLLIADEVVTGFGRTGFPSGVRGWGVKPDMMIFAKAITGGYFPFGATAISNSTATAIEDAKGPAGFIGHGYTNSGHPVGCAAALSALRLTRELGVIENARKLGGRLLEGLETLKSRYETVGDVRGKGLMAAIELVEDKASKVHLAPDRAKKVAAVAAERGVLVRPVRNVIILSPPLIVEESHIDEIVSALDHGLQSIQNK